MPLPDGSEAKSAPGPSTRTQAASVNSYWLICHRRGCLPSGRPRRAGGWEGLGAAALELEGPSAAICSSSWPGRKTAELGEGEISRRRPGHSCRLVPEVLTPAGLPTLQAGLGRGSCSDWGRKREAGAGGGAAILAYFLLHPLLGLSEIGPGQWSTQTYCSTFRRRWERSPLTAPHSTALEIPRWHPHPCRSRGCTRNDHGSGYP